MWNRLYLAYAESLRLSFTGLRFEVEQASCGLSAIAELLVLIATEFENVITALRIQHNGNHMLESKHYSIMQQRRIACGYDCLMLAKLDKTNKFILVFLQLLL